MYSIKRTPLAAALLLALNSPLYSPIASAIPPPPFFGPVAGDEVQVNTETSLSQKSPSIAMDANGNFVVVWQSIIRMVMARESTPSAILPMVRRMATSCRSIPRTGDQTVPRLLWMRPVILWLCGTSYLAEDGNGAGIFAQRYNADGTQPV